MVVEVLVSIRMEFPLFTVRRHGIKYYKPESENSKSNMRTRVVGGDTCVIVRSRSNEKYMKSYKEMKGERETLTTTPEMRMLTNIPKRDKAIKTFKADC